MITQSGFLRALSQVSSHFLAPTWQVCIISIHVAQFVAICDLFGVLHKGFVSLPSFPSGTASVIYTAGLIITGMQVSQSFSVDPMIFGNSLVKKRRKNKRTHM
jgi:hypothetical protein